MLKFVIQKDCAEMRINMDKYINAPISDEDARSLKSGDYVYITGTIYTARDAAHKRMAEALSAGQPLPIDMKNNIIYYMGPSPAREGRPIGSAGPTTASRMDKYAPDLLDLGLKGMIGKGKRSKAVIDAIVRNGAVYFAAVGGAGALLSKCIEKSEIVCRIWERKFLCKAKTAVMMDARVLQTGQRQMTRCRKH